MLTQIAVADIVCVLYVCMQFTATHCHKNSVCHMWFQIAHMNLQAKRSQTVYAHSLTVAVTVILCV
jgi:hypothetical protein